MSEREGFLVEEFLDAITSQLDRTQDALALKAVNRPLTYAVKEFAIDLKVFIQLDQRGNVRVRPSGPNEEGASVMQIGFTTVTRPMIQENTVALETSRSPSLAEIGLDDQERQSLERVGVRNVAELERLQSSTGSGGVSRFSGISVDRLRSALRQGRPIIDQIEMKPRSEAAPNPSPPPPPAGKIKPRVRLAIDPKRQPTPRTRLEPRPVSPPEEPNRRLHLRGRNLLGQQGPPKVTLGDQSLPLVDFDDDHIAVDLPDQMSSRTLSVALPDGEIVNLDLVRDLGLMASPEPGDDESPTNGANDPWQPDGGQR